MQKIAKQGHPARTVQCSTKKQKETQTLPAQNDLGGKKKEESTNLQLNLEKEASAYLREEVENPKGKAVIDARRPHYEKEKKGMMSSGAGKAHKGKASHDLTPRLLGRS